ncbi:hypothetical protein [Comamonas sp. 26]|uniref:hypothetical protein n=1 Tax=Comamonas sp. 26 TaxID=2035201 RepID=UPI000C40AFEC|nr:hypothetical protein [Comamonas sp. 26]PIG09472.1 hypothetical protein CLU84_2383 [Comamonas sp. 26]
MNTKKSAASKAVKAAACLKEPASTVALPSMKQAMLTAVALIQQSLNGLELVRIHDEEWDERDVDVDYAVRLVHECLDKLRDGLPDERTIFDHQWFTAGAIINLCVSALVLRLNELNSLAISVLGNDDSRDTSEMQKILTGDAV